MKAFPCIVGTREGGREDPRLYYALPRKRGRAGAKKSPHSAGISNFVLVVAVHDEFILRGKLHVNFVLISFEQYHFARRFHIP